MQDQYLPKEFKTGSGMVVSDRFLCEKRSPTEALNI